MPVRLHRLVVPAFLCGAGLVPASTSLATDLEAGFVEEVVCEGLDRPTSIAFVRPTLFLVSVKSGDVFAVKNGRVRPAPVISLAVSDGLERGLNGIALQPAFRTSGYLYVHYTVRHSPPFNRVSRFHLAQTGIGPEEILVDELPSHTGVHNGGCLRFAPDGTLFFSAGDGGTILATDPQDLSNLAGKIGRINADGSIPPDNPFLGTPGARPEAYAYGFRNPWRFAIDRATGRVFVNDVGTELWEEVNDARPGANLGWPLTEGPFSIGGSAPPIHAYPHVGADSAVTGGAFYRGSAYPLELDGSYFFADFNRGFVDRMSFDGAGGVLAVVRFATGVPLPVDLVLGPDGNLYCLSFLPGRVSRFRYVGEVDRPPVVEMTIDPDVGRAPLDATLSLAGSHDPDGDPLTFEIDFGDGSTFTTSALAIDHRFLEPRVHTVAVVARDGRGGSDSATVVVDASQDPPFPVIGSPIANSTYAAGDFIPFAGYASDPEDGWIPDAGLTWDIVFHHSEHTHPFLGPLVGQRSGSFRVPTGGETSTDVSYEVRLTAVDSRGARRSTSVYILPRLTTFRVASEPPGMTLNVDGRSVVTPADIASVVGFGHDLDAASPQPGPSGQPLRFTGWIDSSALARRIYAPQSPATYTAIFLP